MTALLREDVKQNEREQNIFLIYICHVSVGTNNLNSGSFDTNSKNFKREYHMEIMKSCLLNRYLYFYKKKTSSCDRKYIYFRVLECVYIIYIVINIQTFLSSALITQMNSTITGNSKCAIFLILWIHGTPHYRLLHFIFLWYHCKVFIFCLLFCLLES